MNNLRKRKNRKHEGEYLWTFPQYANNDGSEYYACQYVLVDDGKAKRVTRGLGVKGTPDYKANLSRHEALARKSLKVRMRDTMDDI